MIVSPDAEKMDIYGWLCVGKFVSNEKIEDFIRRGGEIEGQVGEVEIQVV